LLVLLVLLLVLLVLLLVLLVLLGLHCVGAECLAFAFFQQTDLRTG